MIPTPRRWYVVVGEALLDAAERYQQCRRGEWSERPETATGRSVSSR